MKMENKYYDHNNNIRRNVYYFIAELESRVWLQVRLISILILKIGIIAIICINKNLTKQSYLPYVVFKLLSQTTTTV